MDESALQTQTKSHPRGSFTCQFSLSYRYLSRRIGRQRRGTYADMVPLSLSLQWPDVNRRAKTYRRRSETIRNNVLRREQYGRRNRDLEDPYECQLPSINKIGSSFHSMWCLSITDKAGYFKIWHEEDYTFKCGRKRSLLEISLEKCKICTLCLSLLCTRKAKPFIPFININKNYNIRPGDSCIKRTIRA